MEGIGKMPLEKRNQKNRALDYFLNGIETVGNKLPDPAILFILGLCIIWGFSALLSTVSFDVIDPRTGVLLQINNLLTPDALVSFITRMVTIFTSFPPLGVVLVSMIGIGVSEQSGFIHSAIRSLLSTTPKMLLTPILSLAGLLSHTATDAGYVLVIPLGGVIFYAAGRHPLAGIAAAFAGVSGGFSANLIPGPLDPLIQSFTQSAAQLLNPEIIINPLCNYYFTVSSSFLIVSLTWLITDRFVEPRLNSVAFCGEATDTSSVTTKVTDQDKKAFRYAVLSVLTALSVLVLITLPEGSPLRGPGGDLTHPQAPLMRAIVPLIFVLFMIPGLVFGYISGKFKKSKDVVDAMVKTINEMGHYIVMVFFCALFIDAFASSNIGILIAMKGAEGLRAMALPPVVTIVGIIILCGFVNLFVGSASAKWAIIAPIFVTMLMQVNISPELTQAAYRIGDSSTNIITPLMPYFPLVVVYCQRYVKDAKIGTLVSMMLPYSMAFLFCWSLFLLAYWSLGIPLGISAGYTYP